MSLTRRALLATGVVAALGWTGAGRLAEQRPRPLSADDAAIDAALAQKQALVAALTETSPTPSSPTAIVVLQQQAHMDALGRLRTRRAIAASGAPPSNAAPSRELQRMSTVRLQQALAAADPELARVLVLIAASERVHAEVLK